MVDVVISSTKINCIIAIKVKGGGKNSVRSHAISCALTFFGKKVRKVRTDLDTAAVAFDGMCRKDT